jgi:hypothetical protein
VPTESEEKGGEGRAVVSDMRLFQSVCVIIGRELLDLYGGVRVRFRPRKWFHLVLSCVNSAIFFGSPQIYRSDIKSGGWIRIMDEDGGQIYRWLEYRKVIKGI